MFKITLKPTTSMLSLAVLISLGSSTLANAAAAVTTKPGTSAKLPAVIAAGDSAIASRLVTLAKLNTKVATMKSVSASNKAALTTQITASTSGLTNLKTKLDADKDLTTAKADAASIYTLFRVYRLVVPQVQVVKVADDQQDKANNLIFAGGLLASIVKSSPEAASLQPKVNDLIAKSQQANKAAQTAEATVLPLKPDDYNSNHQLMTTYLTKLKANKVLLTTAYNEGQSVVKSLQADGTLSK